MVSRFQTDFIFIPTLFPACKTSKNGEKDNLRTPFGAGDVPKLFQRPENGPASFRTLADDDCSLLSRTVAH